METRERIAAERRYRGLNQTEVGKHLGIGTGTYCTRETGKSSFTLEEIEKLAALFGTTVQKLIGSKK